MDSDLIELSRWPDADSAEPTKRVLEEAEIPFRIGSTGSISDISFLGTGMESEVIIQVPRGDFDAARAAMESEFLKTELPEDHHLHHATDEDLAEILGKPAEWSPFDVAHARKLAAEKEIDLADIEDKTAERLEALKQGKEAPQWLVLVGWVCSIAGGIVGVGIAWSLCFMKERTPEGDFFTYDKETRETGKAMLALALAVMIIAIIIRLWQILLG